MLFHLLTACFVGIFLLESVPYPGSIPLSDLFMVAITFSSVVFPCLGRSLSSIPLSNLVMVDITFSSVIFPFLD